MIAPNTVDVLTEIACSLGFDLVLHRSVVSMGLDADRIDESIWTYRVLKGEKITFDGTFRECAAFLIGWRVHDAAEPHVKVIHDEHSAVADRLVALERRVALLELRTHVLRPSNNRRVLEVLGGFAKSPFNDGSFAMTPDTIGNATGLDARDLALTLNQLQCAAFVELTKVDGAGHWRITDDGLQAAAFEALLEGRDD